MIDELVMWYEISEERAALLIKQYPGLTMEEIADKAALEEREHVSLEEYGASKDG
jgi:hypothetical protein